MTKRLMHRALLCAMFTLSCFASQAHAQDSAEAAEGIAIADVDPSVTVDFQSQVLPILKKNCVACHNATKSESELSLESPETIRKGGASGATIDLEAPDESLLLMAASHRGEPIMPPVDNTVGAANLSPQELGLIRLWIRQGAQGELQAEAAPLEWQPLPSGVHPIMAADLTADGEYAACGRANQIFIYHLPTKTLLTRLTDPALVGGGKVYAKPGVAHLDIVQSLAFSPDGYTLASGGYREVKLWRRPSRTQRNEFAIAGEGDSAGRGDSAGQADSAGKGDSGPVTTSPDGAWLAFARGKAVHLLHAADGSAGPVLNGHTDRVTAVCFSADSKSVVTAGTDHSIRVWSVADGRELARADSPAPVNGLALSLDGGTIYSADADHLVRAWRTPTVAPRLIAATGALIQDVVVSPDRRRMAIARGDGRVEIRDAHAGRLLQSLSDSRASAGRMAFSSDGKLLALAGGNQVRIWDPATGASPWNIELPAQATAVAFAPKAPFLAAGSADGRLSLVHLDFANQRVLNDCVAPGSAASHITAIAASPDQSLVATAQMIEGRPTILVRRSGDGQVTNRLEGHTGLILALAFSGDGSRIASGSADNTARVWALDGSKEPAIFTGHQASVTAMAFRDDGQQIVSGADDGGLIVWNTNDAAVIATLAGHEGRIGSIAWRGDAQRIVSISSDRSARVWSAADAKQLARVDQEAAPISLALSHDGKSFGIGVASQVRLFDLDGQPIRTFDGSPGPLLAIQFSVDGDRISAVAEQGTTCWQMADGVLLARTQGTGSLTAVCNVPGHDATWLADTDRVIRSVSAPVVRRLADHAAAVTDLQFDIEGTRVFSATAAGVIRRDDIVQPGDAVTVTQEGPVHDLALSQDGKTLASAGEDKQVHLWRAENLEPVATHSGFTAPVHRVAFSTDDRRVIGGTADGQFVVFDVAGGPALQFASTATFGSTPGPAAGIAMFADDSDQWVLSAGPRQITAWALSATGALAGHTDAVARVKLLPPEGNKLISAGADKTIRIWDLASGKEERKIETPDAVTDIAVSADGSRIASIGTDAVGRLWVTADGKPAGEMSGDSRLNQLAARLATLAKVSAQRVAGAKESLAAAEKEVQAAADATKQAADALVAAKTGVDETATAAKTAADAKVAAEKGVADTAAAVKLATDAQAAADKVAADAAAVTAKADELLASAQAAVSALAQAAANAMTVLASASAALESSPQSEDLLNAKQLAEKGASDANSAHAAAQAAQEVAQRIVDARRAESDAAAAAKKAADEALAAATAAAQKATEEKAAADKAATDADAAAKAAVEKHQAAMKAVSDADAATQRAKGMFDTATARTAEMTQQAEAADRDAADAQARAQASQKPWKSVGFSPNGSELALGGDDQQVHLYEAASGRPLAVLPAHHAGVTSLAFTAQGLLCSVSSDQKLRIWQPAGDWQLVGRIGPASADPLDVTSSVLTDRVIALAYSPDGKLLATGGGQPSRSGELKVFNAEDGSLVRDFGEAHSDTVFGVAFSSDGRYLASCGADKFVKVFDLNSGSLVRSFEGHTHHVLGVAWRWDGAVLASCGADQAVKVWNFETGEQQRTIQGFEKAVTSIRFLGETSEALTSAGDQRVRIQNIDDPRKARTFAGAIDFLQVAASTPDGRLVAGGSQDGILRVWTGEDAKLWATFDLPLFPAAADGGAQAK